jgi:hypothetical protein
MRLRVPLPSRIARFRQQLPLPGKPKVQGEFRQCGLEGLTDRTGRPFPYANQIPEQVEAAMVTAKREKPHWGAREIRERLLRKLPHAIKVPAASTIHAARYVHPPRWACGHVRKNLSLWR